MDRDELMRMLNIKPKAVSQGPAPPPVTTDFGPATQEAQASPYALELDEFDRNQGGKILRHNKEARETGLEPKEMSDIFAANFLADPTLVEKCEDARRHEFMGKTLENPDYKALHRSTELNHIASELASIELAKSYAKLKEGDKERQEKREKNKQKGKKDDPGREKMQDEMACQRAVSKGLKEASKEVEEYEDTMTALGCGPGQGGDNKMDVGRVAQIYQKTKDSSTLRRIMELAGRYRRVAQAKQRQKVIHGVDDMVGVVLDGDVGRLLPHELGMLATPEFELDAMRRLVERQSMCRQYRGVEKVGKGPIVVCVDESGSMHGEPVAQAKAFALAMAWVARHQKRWIALIGYSGGTEGTKLAMPPGKWDEAGLLDWLEHFFGGGTTMDVPLEQLPQQWWPEFVNKGLKRGATDLIIITDAQVWVPGHIESRFNAWKQQEKAKCITLVLGGHRAGDLARVSDEVYLVPNINLDQEAIQRCLSI